MNSRQVCPQLATREAGPPWPRGAPWGFVVFLGHASLRRMLSQRTVTSRLAARGQATHADHLHQEAPRSRCVLYGHK